MNTTFAYGAASAAVEIDSGLCLITMRGPITSDTLQRLRLDVLLHVPRETAHVILFRWSEALCAFSPDELALLTDSGVTTLNLPACHLSSTAMLRLFQVHAVSMIDEGIVRIAVDSLARTRDFIESKIRVGNAKREGVEYVVIRVRK